MQTTDQSTDEDLTRRKYKDGVPTKRFRYSGVKKLFILALAPSTQENYTNVHQLWTTLDLNQLEELWWSEEKC